MEADDTCGSQRLLTLQHALREHPDWDAAFGPTKVTGDNQFITKGMNRYVEWQNMLQDPEDLAANRFIEIPALHQAGICKTLP